MKHIILYINSMKPAGGIERVVSILATNLSKFYKISILVKDSTISFYPVPNDIDITSLNYPLYLNMNSRISRIYSLLKHLFGIKRRLKHAFDDLNADFIYITTPYACLETFIAGIAKKQVIISEHGARINHNLIYRIMKSLLYKKYAIQIVPTMQDYQWFKKNGYPSIHIPHFRSLLAYKKNKLESKIVLNIGRLTDDKNQMALLRVWGNLINNYNVYDWKLLIVGNGENFDIINSYVLKNSLKNYVEIVPPSSSVEKYYNSASIYASTSRSEGFPMVIVEAISFGLPTIAFDCPTGPSEILDNDAGILIPLNDEKKFTEMLFELISNPALRKKLSHNAFERSISWGEEAIIKKWHLILGRDSSEMPITDT